MAGLIDRSAILLHFLMEREMDDEYTVVEALSMTWHGRTEQSRRAEDLLSFVVVVVL